jgi:hypothetical protein
VVFQDTGILFGGLASKSFPPLGISLDGVACTPTSLEALEQVATVWEAGKGMQERRCAGVAVLGLLNRVAGPPVVDSQRSWSLKELLL